MVGGYKVTWKTRFLGDRTQVYIGLNAADAIENKSSTLTLEIKKVIALAYNLEVEKINLLEVKAGRKKLPLAKLNTFRGLDMPF